MGLPEETLGGGGAVGTADVEVMHGGQCRELLIAQAMPAMMMVIKGSQFRHQVTRVSLTRLRLRAVGLGLHHGGHGVFNPRREGGCSARGQWTPACSCSRSSAIGGLGAFSRT